MDGRIRQVDTDIVVRFRLLNPSDSFPYWAPVLGVANTEVTVAFMVENSESWTGYDVTASPSPFVELGKGAYKLTLSASDSPPPSAIRGTLLISVESTTSPIAFHPLLMPVPIGQLDSKDGVHVYGMADNVVSAAKIADGSLEADKFHADFWTAHVAQIMQSDPLAFADSDSPYLENFAEHISLVTGLLQRNCVTEYLTRNAKDKPLTGRITIYRSAAAAAAETASEIIARINFTNAYDVSGELLEKLTSTRDSSY